MDPYMSIKGIHMLTAYLTVLMMLLRMGLELMGKPGWRQTPLRWIPHANDTLLLISALLLLWITAWMPFVHHWLTGKVIFLIGYILAGKWALDQKRSVRIRLVAGALALAQLAIIFALAFVKPVI